MPARTSRRSNSSGRREGGADDRDHWDRHPRKTSDPDQQDGARRRVQDAVARIDAGDVADLSTLAVQLGWYDQAHFSRDFTDVVGVSPGLYLRRSLQPRPAPGGA